MRKHDATFDHLAPGHDYYQGPIVGNRNLEMQIHRYQFIQVMLSVVQYVEGLDMTVQVGVTEQKK